MTETEILQAFILARPFPQSYWVMPGRLLAGEYPGSMLIQEAQEKTGGLLALGIDTFIDLTQMDHLDPYEPILRREAARLGKAYIYHKLGVKDQNVPSKREMKHILDVIDEALAAGHNVYVHCWGGIGRTGTVVGCYLARHGVTGQAALDEIAQLRQVVPSTRVSPETDGQRQMVTGWQQGQ